MITDALLVLMGIVIDILINVRPDFEIPVPDGLVTLVQQCLTFNSIAPVLEIAQVCTLGVSIQAAMFGWKWFIKIVDYIADVIP